MYPLDPRKLYGLRDGRWAGVGPNVLFLGLTSMLTDISAEMVTSVLPIYLLYAVGLTPLQFGLIDGLSHAAAALARLGSGLVADRWQRNREVALVGYGLSALCKLLLLAAGSAWTLISTSIVLDRIGKAVRTAPRDALISLSSSPQRLGLAFGVHRAMDTAGALVGPLVAFAILAYLPHGYDVVFVTSFFVAVIGMAALLCFVRNVVGRLPASAEQKASIADLARLFRSPKFRSMVLVGTGLGLVTVGDAFFFLLAQRRLSMQASSFPLLYALTALSYLFFVIPAGRLADRLGRGRVFVLGHGLLLLAAVSLLASGEAKPLPFLSLALLGAYYACTDGVLMAAASSLLPVKLRTTGLAVLATATGIARLLASVFFGAIWSWQTAEFALGVFSVGLAVALWPASKAIAYALPGEGDQRPGR